MTENECKTEIRRLRVENQNLRKRTHATIHSQARRIRELQAQIEQDAWVLLPHYTMDSVKELDLSPQEIRPNVGEAPTPTKGTGSSE